MKEMGFIDRDGDLSLMLKDFINPRDGMTFYSPAEYVVAEDVDDLSAVETALERQRLALRDKIASAVADGVSFSSWRIGPNVSWGPGLNGGFCVGAFVKAMQNEDRAA